MKRAGRVSKIAGMGFLIAFLVMGGCATTQKVQNISSDAVNCPAEISWDITKAAYVTGFSCFVKPYKGKEMLQYKISFKNVASEPLRFRVHIIDPDGKSVGGLVPRKGKPPAVKPDAEVSFVYPVPAYTSIPKKLNVSIMEISPK